MGSVWFLSGFVVFFVFTVWFCAVEGWFRPIKIKRKKCLFQTEQHEKECQEKKAKHRSWTQTATCANWISNAKWSLSDMFHIIFVSNAMSQGLRNVTVRGSGFCVKHASPRRIKVPEPAQSSEAQLSHLDILDVKFGSHLFSLLPIWAKTSCTHSEQPICLTFTLICSNVSVFITPFPLSLHQYYSDILSFFSDIGIFWQGRAPLVRWGKVVQRPTKENPPSLRPECVPVVTRMSPDYKIKIDQQMNASKAEKEQQAHERNKARWIRTFEQSQVWSNSLIPYYNQCYKWKLHSHALYFWYFSQHKPPKILISKIQRFPPKIANPSHSNSGRHVQNRKSGHQVHHQCTE